LHAGTYTGRAQPASTHLRALLLAVLHFAEFVGATAAYGNVIPTVAKMLRADGLHTSNRVMYRMVAEVFARCASFRCSAHSLLYCLLTAVVFSELRCVADFAALSYIADFVQKFVRAGNYADIEYITVSDVAAGTSTRHYDRCAFAYAASCRGVMAGLLPPIWAADGTFCQMEVEGGGHVRALMCPCVAAPLSFLSLTCLRDFSLRFFYRTACAPFEVSASLGLF
jgi:hypothetical protein